MLKRLVLAMFMLAGAPAVAAPCDIDGDWDGTLLAGAIKLRVSFHIATQNGMAGGTMTSVDQGNLVLPLSSVTCDAPNVVLAVDKIHGAYQATLAPDGKSMSGSWSQGGAVLPLMVTRRGPGQTGFLVRRPQEPHPPFPYRSEDVVFDGPGGIKLAGTITIPNGSGAFAAVVLIQGSGPHDRDEAIMGHKPFLVLADYLTRHGIATLRVDKRGIANSTGDYAAATSLDFADDAQAAIAYLKSRPQIDRAKIGLIGHSEGGIIAPIVAARDASVAFIVLMAGPGIPGDILLELQSRLINAGMGASKEQVEHNADLQRRLIAAVKSAKDTGDAQTKAKAIMDALPPGAETQAATAQIATLASPWFRFFLNYDPAVYLRQVKCPVLAIDGEKDLQVPPKEDLAGIRAALAGNPDVQTIELPGLNHLMQTATTGLPAEYGDIEETMAPIVLETITTWIVKHTSGHP